MVVVQTGHKVKLLSSAAISWLTSWWPNDHLLPIQLARQVQGAFCGEIKGPFDNNNTTNNNDNNWGVSYGVIIRNDISIDKAVLKT